MREFLSYGKQWIDEDDIRAVTDALKSDFLTQGPRVAEFEAAICAVTGAKYCVAVANGTAALHLAVAALELERGMEGITSTNTFAASANTMLYNNLTPILADLDPRTYNISPGDLEKRIRTQTKLVIPVHFAGQPADMEQISEIAGKSGLFVIEDAAHAIGSRYHDGSMVGNCRFSHLTTFSFHPVKTVTTGEGGAITINDEALYKKLLSLRSHGMTKDPTEMSRNPGPWYYEMQMLGFNYRLTDIQAALGISQLNKLALFAEKRRRIVQQYNSAFSGIEWLQIPYERADVESVFHLYVLKIDFESIGMTRDAVMRYLKENNIGTQVHYIPVHTLPYYQQSLGYRWGDLPVAEAYYEQALSIPLYPRLTDEQVEYVIEKIAGLENVR